MGLPNSVYIRDQFELIFEENLINPILNCFNKSIIEYKNLFSNSDNERQDKNELKKLINELNDSQFLERIKKSYPLFKTMRQNQMINLRWFESKFRNSDMNKKFPFIDLYLKHKETLEKLEALPNLIKTTSFLMNKYDHFLMRKDARDMKLIECFGESELVKEDYKNTVESWNKYLNINLQDGCKEYKGVKINDNTSLLLMLIDDRAEIGAGIQSRLALQYLSACQNSFIEEVLSFSNQLSYLSKFNSDKLSLNLVKNQHVINVKEFDAERFVQLNSYIDPEYGKGMQIEFDYEKFQFILLNKLFIGKRLLQSDKDKIRKIQFSGELFDHNAYLISNLREKLKQEPIDNEKLLDVKKFIEEFKKENEIIKKVFISLETLICFIASSFDKNPNKSLKRYTEEINLKNLTDHVRKLEPLSSLCLKNIVQIYEIFEDEMFVMSSSQFDEKYKKDLDQQTILEFEKFWEKCDGNILPTKQEFYQALKRFSMRCLLADLDVSETIIYYLYYRTDFWPERILDQKLENIEKYFPKSILVQNALGNFIEIVKREFTPKPIIEPKPSITIPTEPFGRPSNRVLKPKPIDKKKNKFEFF